jgi:hypothetical protein
MHLAPIQSGSPVLFRGVLSILNLSHLSEKGIQYINHALQERITGSYLGVPLAKSHSRHRSLDVEALFALKAEQRGVPEVEKLKIDVIIQGIMHSTASFMRCKSHLFTYPLAMFNLFVPS